MNGTMKLRILSNYTVKRIVKMWWRGSGNFNHCQKIRAIDPLSI